MKKYDVSLQKYDELSKIGISKWVTRLMLWSIGLFWVTFIVFGTVIFKNNYFIQIGMIGMLILTVGVFMTMILMNVIKQDKFRKENKEYFEYKKKDVLDYIELKKQNYSSNHIKNYVNTLVDEHYSDKDKLKEELYKYIHNDKMINDIWELLNYEEMDKDLDVEI